MSYLFLHKWLLKFPGRFLKYELTFGMLHIKCTLLLQILQFIEFMIDTSKRQILQMTIFLNIDNIINDDCCNSASIFSASAMIPA